MLDRPSPNHDKIRPQTLGVVLHGTDGHAGSVEAEFNATIGWFASTASQVSAHVVIAWDGTIAQCVNPDWIAWHCRELNHTHCGLEFVHPTVDSPLSDAQYASAAWWIKQMAARYGFVPSATTLPEHRETIPGIRDGRRDVGGPFDKARLLGMVG